MATTELELMNKNKLGMLIFLASDVVFFAMLILSYAYYRHHWGTGPTDSVLDIKEMLPFTLALWSSSFTIWMSERSLRRGSIWGMRLWLLLTILLGGFFLWGEATEYLKLYSENVNIAAGMFGSTFFTVTGFHGLHVSVGLVALLTMFVISLTGWVKPEHAENYEALGYYWHFVDLVWVFVFSIIYVWGLVPQ